MLITFRCERSHPVLMFSEVAFALLERMGLPASARGHIVPEDIPGLLDRLDRALREDAVRAAEAAKRTDRSASTAKPGGPPAGPPQDEGEDDKKARPVALAARAFPLKKLLRRAHERGYAVSWD